MSGIGTENAEEFRSDAKLDATCPVMFTPPHHNLDPLLSLVHSWNTHSQSRFLVSSPFPCYELIATQIQPYFVTKPMGFALEGLWVMGFHSFMGYGLKFPTHQVSGPKNVWEIRGYGLYPLWVKRDSTVAVDGGGPPPRDHFQECLGGMITEDG